MLCLPIDILAHHVTQGNTVGGRADSGQRAAGALEAHSCAALPGLTRTLPAPPPHTAMLLHRPQALQEPLGVALGVLEDIEAFRQALVAADVARVRRRAGGGVGAMLAARDTHTHSPAHARTIGPHHRLRTRRRPTPAPAPRSFAAA